MERVQTQTMEEDRMTTITSNASKVKATKAAPKKVTKTPAPIVTKEPTATEKLRQYKGTIQETVVSGDIDAILTMRQSLILLKKLVLGMHKVFDDSVTLANNGTNGEFLSYVNPDGEKCVVKTIIDRSPKNKNGKKVVVVDTKYEI
jgi:hypothetical protein